MRRIVIADVPVAAYEAVPGGDVSKPRVKPLSEKKNINIKKEKHHYSEVCVLSTLELYLQ